MSNSDVVSENPWRSCWTLITYLAEVFELIWEELVTAYKKRCKKRPWWHPLRWLCVISVYFYYVLASIFFIILWDIVWVVCVIIHGGSPYSEEEDRPEAEEEEPEQPILLRRLRERPQKPREKERTVETPKRTLSNCPRCLASAIALVGIAIYVLLRELTRQK